MRVLVGATGFVGGALQRQVAFELGVSSADARRIEGIPIDELVLACLPAQKWRADQNPQADRDNLDRVCDLLRRVGARRVVLVSTVDVYESAHGHDEASTCLRSAPGYGAHRRLFEEFVRERFDDVLVLRLPALFGAGLKKNHLFDLIHRNQLEQVSLDAVFQWYPVDRLWRDVQALTAAGVRLCNLVTEPIATREIVRAFFPSLEDMCLGRATPRYELATRHAGVFGRPGPWIMTRDEVMARIGRFVATGA